MGYLKGENGGSLSFVLYLESERERDPVRTITALLENLSLKLVVLVRSQSQKKYAE